MVKVIDVTGEKKSDKVTGTQLIHILENYLNQRYDFRYNELQACIEWKYAGMINEYIRLDDYKLNSIERELELSNIKASVNKIDRLLKSDYTKKFHPIKKYFEESNLSIDKNVNYIRNLLDTVKVKNPDMWEVYFTKWIVAVVANVMIDKGCQNHTCLVLTGEQGKYKTTWLDNLCPPELKDYLFTGKLDPYSKDSLTLLAEYFLLNIDDQLRNLNTKDENALKTLITIPSVKYRKPYAQYVTHYSRIASFMGSVNNNEFLTDPSGSRRFLPFEVEKIDINKAKNISHIGVYGYALELLKNNYNYWFNDTEVENLFKRNLPFEVNTLEYDIILEYLKVCKREEATHFHSLGKIKEYLENMSKQKLHIKKIGEAMKKLGFEKWQTTKASQRQWVYSVIVKEGIEITSQNENKENKKSW